jgi:two-component system cell cycle sensor histidine kinase/response regulator CckA
VSDHSPSLKQQSSTESGGTATDSARMLELGFDLAVMPTALLDGSGLYIRVNAAFAALFARNVESFVGRSFIDLTHPDDRARDQRLLGELAKSSDQQMTIQKRYLREDGSTIFARTAVTVVRRADGRPTVYMSEVQDITSLHGALNALKVSEERLNFAMQATNDGLWDWDYATGDLITNDNWSTMLGYAPGSIHAHVSSWEQLAHPDDVPRAYAELERHIRGEIAQVDFEMRLRRSDGSWLWIRNRAKVVSRLADGTPRRIVGTHTDISAQRAQAETLQRQAALLDSVLSNIPIAIDIIGADGRVEYINAHAERLLGWSLEDMGNTDVMARIYPDPEYRARVYASMVEESAAWRDWELHTRDGRVLTMAWSNVRLSDGRVIGMGTDVTAVRAAEAAEERIERQMQQAQKLESLGVLAGGIAHDFNNLLVGVLGNASLAEELLAPGSDAAHLVAEVRAAATRAAELTRQLLAYAGKGRFVVEPVDVSLLVGEMATLLRAATSKQAVLRQELATGLPAVEADATQLRQVVMNLITNASDALGDDAGTITLRTFLCEPDESERGTLAGGAALSPGKYVCIEVLDTGSGMSGATISRIFDPFFTTKPKGHGLGLAATHGIIRSHRGGIALRSAEGHGTAICIYLPALATSAKPSLTPHAGEVRALRGHGDILLADDEPAVRQVAARALERSGFQITQATDGAVALRMFEAEPLRWRAVVLDLTMPNLGGQEALVRMRALRSDLPAVLCSGYASEELNASVTSMAQVNFVQKPFTVSRLVAAVLEVLPPH